MKDRWVRLRTWWHCWWTSGGLTDRIDTAIASLERTQVELGISKRQDVIARLEEAHEALAADLKHGSGAHPVLALPIIRDIWGVRKKKARPPT